MRCELDHDRPARYAEQLNANVDDCPPQRQPVFRRTTTTKLNHDLGNGLKAGGTKVIKIVLTELGDPDIRSP